MARKRRVSVEAGTDDIPQTHRPKRKQPHVAMEALDLDQPDLAAELTRGLRARHKDATLMRVKGARKTFDGRITR